MNIEQLSYPELEAAHERVVNDLKHQWDTVGRTDALYSDLLTHIKASTDLPFYRLLSVIIPPGQNIHPHLHAENDVYVYMLHDHPAALLTDEGLVETIQGRLVHVPAGLRHSVERNGKTAKPRHTLAFMFWNLTTDDAAPSA